MLVSLIRFFVFSSYQPEVANQYIFSWTLADSAWVTFVSHDLQDENSLS